ncbi:hypothetical protein GSU68_04465 [Rathayibacter sp. VKM Ac-2759]|uniref:hypothetical protein n=1 Tax=Rathayibacter sp. VKM Ac-2759 TaxID=2609252 RepID=UPI0013184C63|nr:hypothetical protein [Rathayibacter sp. VKM Ac-2759]QHC65909.1 hypothetical protein GSU68_04465 [Rathayibacter sp. VKM Ac-2759]
MHIRSRPLLTAVLAATVLAALTGCVPAADTAAEPVADPTAAGGAAAPASATPSASGSATPAPGGSATPSPAMADAVSLLIGPTSFSLVDASGTELGTWDYRNGTGAVEALTEAFGSAPTESDDVPYEGFRSRVSGWPGFAFKDTEVYDAGGPELEFPEPDFMVDATAPSVGDVAISTLGGVAVGDATRDVVAQHPDGVPEGGSLGLFLFDETTVGSHNGGDLVNSVMAVAEDEITVSRIAAPSANWGV